MNQGLLLTLRGCLATGRFNACPVVWARIGEALGQRDVIAASQGNRSLAESLQSPLLVAAIAQQAIAATFKYRQEPQEPTTDNAALNEAKRIWDRCGKTNEERQEHLWADAARVLAHTGAQTSATCIWPRPTYGASA